MGTKPIFPKRTRRLVNVRVASSLFEVASSLQSKQNAGLSEQQQGYLLQTNVVLPHKTSQQAHVRLSLQPPSHLYKHGFCQIFTRSLSYFNKHGPRQMYTRPLSHFFTHSLRQTLHVLSSKTSSLKSYTDPLIYFNSIRF